MKTHTVLGAGRRHMRGDAICAALLLAASALPRIAGAQEYPNDDTPTHWTAAAPCVERTPATDRPFIADMSGMMFGPFDGTYVITRVDDDAAAARAGLRERDLIVSVGSRAASDLSFHEISSRLRSGEGDEVEMCVFRRTDGREICTTLVLEPPDA
jgi:predicted metalloprotease with PDZ domain